MINRICFILLISFSSAFADTSLVIGASNIYTNINDSQYRYKNEYEQIGNSADYNVGVFGTHLGLSYGFTTNRLSSSKESNRRVIDKNKTELNLKSKVLTHSLSVGYLLGRFNPSLFVTRADVKKDLYYKDNKVGSERDIALLYGLTTSYFFTDKINGGIILIAPNKELDLEFGAGLFINYLIKL